MNGPMLLITQSGLATSLSWWAHMRVEGDSVVLGSSSEEGWPDSCLVVAALASEEEAKDAFRTINERILLRARKFDARDWPCLIREEVSHDTTESSGE